MRVPPKLHACIYLTVIACAVTTAPTKRQPNEQAPVDDLKAKLETLQRLLQELSMKSDGSQSAVNATKAASTPGPTTTTTTTTISVLPSGGLEGKHQEPGANEEFMNFVSQLTPADIAALKVVKAKLMSLKEKLDSQSQVNEISQVLRSNLQNQLSPQRELPPQKLLGGQGQVLANQPLVPGMSSQQPVASVIQPQPALQPLQRQINPQLSGNSFEPILRELHRQNVLHNVKRDLLKTMKMARDNGITLLEVLQALQEDRGNGKPEAELQSLSRHTG